MKLFRCQKGAVLIVMALGLSGLLAVAALVGDLGLMYLNKVEVANAADAAALAGIQELPAGEEKATALALEYGHKNRVEDITVEVSPDQRELRVHARRTINLFFGARLFSINTSTAAAQAAARLEPVTGVKGIVPLGVPEQSFVFGETYILKYGAGNAPEGEYHSGWYGILALQGPGAKLYEEDLKLGFNEEIKIGDILNIQTGNISGNTFEGIQYRIDQCKHTPACTAEQYSPDCTRIILIPIISSYGDKKVQVKGFSAFFVESVAGMGNENYITGKFLQQYVVPGTGSPAGPDNGVYVSRLIQ